MYHRLLVLFLLGARLVVAQDAGPAAARLVIATPQDYQVVQRESRWQGRMAVTGTIHLTGDGVALERVEARLTGRSAAGDLPDQWKPVKCDAATDLFSGEFTVPAGGWYRLEVRFAQRGQWVITNLVEHVGVGEVFVIAGQSNSANYGEEKNHTVTGLVAAFGGTNWQPAADPEPGAGGRKGSFLPVFGDAMANEFQVPVGLVPMGIGSTSVREWLPGGVVFTNPPSLLRNVVAVAPGQWESNGKIFENFCARMKGLGPRGFRAVLWHQGESDGRQAKPECSLSGTLYHDYLARLIQESRRETGWAVPWFVAQVSYHNPGDLANPELRSAQKALWDEGVALEGPDTDTLTGTMREKNGQGIHLSAAGLQAHGRMWADRVSPWLETQLGKASR